MARDRNAGTGSVDRRRFLQTAALLAAGSALGSSLTGCGFEFNIPCLGPASAPAPVPGMTYIRASEIGCALDCNLKNGHNKYTGGHATDDGPRINAAMAGATADHPITLIIDGSALVSGLFLPAGGHWSIAGLGCGTGIFLKKGTNNDGIHNGPPDAAAKSDPGPPAPARGRNVSLSNFTLNGNQGDGSDGNSTSGKRQGVNGKAWYFGINLMNLNNIVIEKVVVVNTSAYQIRLSNVGNVVVSGCVMRTLGANSDGIHCNGPANDITISNCDITSGDDGIALNCPEGYTGDISRVTVTGCTFNSFTLMRLYTIYLNEGPDFKIDTVSVSNCSGTLSEAAFAIGYIANALHPNSVTALNISNCSLTAPAVLEISENFGNIALSKVTFIPSHSPWTCGFLRSSPLYDGSNWIGSSLTIDDCVISRKSGRKVIGAILKNGSTINSLTFNGFGAQDAGSDSPLPELLNFDSASVGQLVLSSVDSATIKAPVAEGQFSSIGSVSGAGVLATGWEFPDAVMANGVPYISANSGLPSIKVDGVVEPYPQP